MRKSIAFFTLAAALSVGSLAAAQDVTAPPSPDAFALEEFASGFTRPILLTNAGDGSNRLFVVEQGGTVWILEDDQRLETPFLDVSDLVSQEANDLGGYTERGLLGMAFHPDYETNGQFFIHYTDRAGDTVIARYQVSSDANAADAASNAVIFATEQPYANHNGGEIAFGPDGYLYIGLGDGGAAGDPENRAQNLSTPLGKILRIDVSDTDAGYTVPDDNPFVDQADAVPEIWSYGLRNPWRFSFDRETGDLYIGDVGQNQWEEVNFQPADSTGAENYGWRPLEGDRPYSGEPLPAEAVEPIATYSHSEGVSISGGFVYRGEAIPELQGVYLYGDFGTGRIWYAMRDEAGAWMRDELIHPGYTISSFGEDEAGELYVVNYTGTILRFEPRA